MPTMRQVLDDESDPAHAKVIRGLIDELWRAFDIRPGVTERQALRDKMESAQSADDTPPAVS
jgi:hypothetical protein